jgi:hypothetical protein
MQQDASNRAAVAIGCPAHSVVNDRRQPPVAQHAIQEYRQRAAFGVIPMTSLPIRIVVYALVLAFVSVTSAEAAKSRKYKTRVAAPTAVAAAPQYRGANLFPAGPVMYGNEYLGTDPDPFIRAQLLRDLGAHFGGKD